MTAVHPRQGEGVAEAVERVRLSKAQVAALQYMAREDYVATPTGNPSVTQRILAEKGLCTISETYGRAGFYGVRLTDAGSTALSTYRQTKEDTA